MFICLKKGETISSLLNSNDLMTPHTFKLAHTSHLLTQLPVKYRIVCKMLLRAFMALLGKLRRI